MYVAFTARRYASAVYAVVSPSVCLSVTSWCPALLKQLAQTSHLSVPKTLDEFERNHPQHTLQLENDTRQAHIYKMSQQSNPPHLKKVLNNILAYGKPFSTKFYPIIGSLYPQRCTKFGEFTLKYSELEVELHLLALHVSPRTR